MADQDHGPRLPIRARKSTSSAVRSQRASASGNVAAAAPPSISLSTTFNPYSFVAGMPIPRSAQLPSLSANPRVHGGGAMGVLVPSDSEPTRGSVRASQARGGSAPIERGTQLPASTAREIGAAQAEVLPARPFSTTPTIDVARLLLRLPDPETRTPAPSSAVVRYLMDFPNGFENISTSGEGRLCGFRAVINTMIAMYPSLPRPTVNDLQDVFNSREFAEIGAEFGLTNTDDFHVDQIGACLHLWGTKYHGLNLQLGYLPEGQVAQLVPHPNEDPTTVIWISNDNAQLLADQTLIPTLLNHFSGVRPLKNKHSIGNSNNEQSDESDFRATPPTVLSESRVLVDDSEVSEVLERLAPSDLFEPQAVPGGRPKRREWTAEHNQASRKKQARYCRPETGSQTGEGAGVVALDPAARQTRRDADAASSKGTDSGKSQEAAIPAKEHPYTQAVLYEIHVVEGYIKKCQARLSTVERRYPNDRIERYKAILRLLRHRQETLASDIREMERMPRSQEYSSTVRRIIDQSGDPQSRYNLFQSELEGLVRCESTPDNKSMIAELIRLMKNAKKLIEPVPRDPIGGNVRSSALKAAASFSRGAAEGRLEDDRTRARIKRARQERASRAR